MTTCAIHLFILRFFSSLLPLLFSLFSFVFYIDNVALTTQQSFYLPISQIHYDSLILACLFVCLTVNVLAYRELRQYWLERRIVSVRFTILWGWCFTGILIRTTVNDSKFILTTLLFDFIIFQLYLFLHRFCFVQSES